MRRDEIRVLPGGYTCFFHYWKSRRWWLALYHRNAQVAYKDGLESREAALLWAIEEIERREGLNENGG